jgi:transposase
VLSARSVGMSHPPLSGRETAITTIAQSEPTRVTVGVDTHGDVHVACAKDQLGRNLATTRVATTPTGYRALLDWARGLGQVEAFGVEGSGCYGAALARFLAAQGQVVLEVNRPDRSARRRRGKSDPVDAEAAARAVQAGEATAIPKTGGSIVEMVRCLRVARATAMKARTQAANALRALVVTAPAELREQLRDLDAGKLAVTAARLRPGAIVTPTAATKLALRTLAERWLTLTAELTALDPNWTGSPPGQHPPYASCAGSALRSLGRCWWPPAMTRLGCARRPPSQCCAGPHRSRPLRARPCGTA